MTSPELQESPPVAPRGYKRAGTTRPKHGPYATSWVDSEDGKWRIRLTEEGRQKVAEYLEKWPDPAALLASVHRSYSLRCDRLGIPRDEVSQTCRGAVVHAVVRWRPERGSIVTTVAMALRAEVQTLIAQKLGHAGCCSFSERTYLDGSRDSILDGEYAELARFDPEPVDPDAVEPYLRVLRPRMREMIEARYGLAGNVPGTMAQIAIRFGVTKEAVRQNLERALRYMRDAAAGRGSIQQRTGLLEFLKHNNQPFKPAALSRALNIPPKVVRAMIEELIRADELVRGPGSGEVHAPGYENPLHKKEPDDLVDGQNEDGGGDRPPGS